MRVPVRDGKSRRQLLRWSGWFAAANTAVYALVAQRYLWYYPFPDDLPGLVYVALAFVGQFALLASLPLLLILSLVIAILPSRRLVLSIGVLIASTGLSLLFLDTNVFAEQRFHLSRLIMELFEWFTWAMLVVFFVIILFFQSMLAGMVWRNFAMASGPKGGKWIAAGLACAWLGSQGLHIWGDAVGHTPVTQFTRFMPLYFPIHAKRDLARLGLVDPEQVRKRRMLRGSVGDGDGQLQYPLQPMDCRADAAGLPNILIVLIDGLRPDAIHPELTPNLNEFRASSLSFNRHFSGGNSSRMGIFSLFYGLPSTYFQSFYDLQRPPVLMDQIKHLAYETGLFSGVVGFGSPMQIDRTVFAGWPDLQEHRSELSVVERTAIVTDDWVRWIGEFSGPQPFFGFIYYDPPSGEMPDPPQRPLPLDDWFTDDAEVQSEWRQYRQAMSFVDGHIGRVVGSLRQREQMENTIVIITSDHGFEFDDNGLGYIGHASNFSPAQLRATLMIHWPGKTAREYTHRTAHHDVPVTLLQEVFECKNPPREYSMGQNLFAGKSWSWMMAGSYTNHAIIETDRVIVSRPGGYVEVFGADYKPVSDFDLDPGLIQDSLEVQRRFYK
jgi:membrane-anchored protein YejM (alkaline phosphatase superfamily)